YPELKASAERVSKVVLAEEEQFARVIGSGLSRLDSEIKQAIALYENEETFETAKLAYLRDLREMHRIDHESALRFFAQFLDELKIDFSSSLDPVNRVFEQFVVFARPRLAPDNREKYIRAVREFSAHASKRKGALLDGRVAFHLYETFGLPLDFMTDAARDAGIEFDYE